MILSVSLSVDRSSTTYVQSSLLAGSLGQICSGRPAYIQASVVEKGPSRSPTYPWCIQQLFCIDQAVTLVLTGPECSGKPATTAGESEIKEASSIECSLGHVTDS